MRYESINRPLTLGGHVELKSYFTGSSAWLHSTCGQILDKVLLSLISHASLTVQIIKSVLRLYLTAVVLTTAKKKAKPICVCQWWLKNAMVLNPFSDKQKVF